MKVLDLFCCAGGAAMGLHRAWPDAEITGVDINPQPRYPFRFVQADAMTYPLDGFDFIWASPPCQAYSRMHKLNQAQGNAKEHPRLIEATRARLMASGIPYIIENVEGAPLRNPVKLCGSMFGLLVQRHRLFETSFFTLAPDCRHEEFISDKPPLHRLQGVSRVVGCYGNGRGQGDNKALWERAMGITWMVRKEIAQAIPPAYSEYLAKQFQGGVTHGA